MEKIRNIYRVFLLVLKKIYVHNVIAPWLEAGFYSSWKEYQRSEVYHERLTGAGFQYALNAFLRDRGEQKYYLKVKKTKEPLLRLRIWFAPFTISVPDMLEIASQSGAI